MTTDGEHQYAITLALRAALHGYVAQQADGVLISVIQAAIGHLVTDTFDHVTNEQYRRQLLDGFCTCLRQAVEEINEAQRDDEQPQKQGLH